MNELTERPPESPPAVRVDVSWAEAIYTTEELIAAADLIVVGTLGQEVRPWVPPQTAAPGPTEEPSDFQEVQHEFLVEIVVKGAVGVRATLWVTDWIQPSNGARILERDERPLEAGGRYLLFLVEGHGGGVWGAVNGPLGQYEVGNDGTVRMMTTCYEAGLDFDGRPLKSVIDTIEAKAP